VASWSESLVEKIIALLLLLLTFPILISLGLMRKARGKSFFQSCQCHLTKASHPFKLTGCPPVVHLLGFGSEGTFVGKLPGLLEVLRGRIRLVGVRPLSESKPPVYREEWTHLREQAPCGLFSPVDAEGLNESTEEEKIVAENYYAATRSFIYDVKILFQACSKLVFGHVNS
jgi:hypothetical protein